MDDPHGNEVPTVVLDTNIFVAAAFNRRSAAARIIEHIREGTLRMVWTPGTRGEIEAVLRQIPPISWEPFANLFTEATRYDGDLDLDRYQAVSDPDDRKFLALAEATGATLVTDDDHLLSARAQATVPVSRAGEVIDSYSSRAKGYNDNV